MARRKHKQSRKKTKFQKVQESLRKISGPDSKNENKERSDSSHPRSPESVLFESQPADLQCGDKLSPEIIPKQPRRRSKSFKDDPKIDDGIAARMIQQPSPISSKSRELDLAMCDFEHGTKYMNNFRNLEDSGERKRDDATKPLVDDPFELTESYFLSLSSLSNEHNNNNANRTTDGRSSKIVDEMTHRNTSVISRPDLKSQSRDDVRTFANIPGPVKFDEEGSLGVRSNQRKDHYIIETMDDCYLLDKTLSMNDNLAHQMNSYLARQSPTVVVNKLGRDPEELSEVPHFMILRENDERGELSGSPVHGSIGGPRDNPNKKMKGTSNGNKRVEVALERIGERLTANWREFRKIFGHLRRKNRNTRGEEVVDRGECLLHRYRRLPYVSVSTLSLPTSSVPCTPSSSPKLVSYDKVREFGGTRREAEKAGIPAESTTPRTGSVKRLCRRTTLTFGNEDDDGEVAGHRQPATRADITDPLPEGKKESKGRLLLLGSSPFSDETRQDGRIPESIIASDVELSDRNGHGGGSPQKAPQNVATPRDSRSHVSRPRRRNISRTIITWVIAICIWLIRKLLHLVNVNYNKLRQKLTVSPSSSSWTKKFDCLTETMRSESEMLRAMSEKMTRLSEDFVQMQTTTEATLNALTAEMNVFREASKKITEDNVVLLQELKKLRETLEEVQIKSLQPVTLPSSCPLSSRSSLPALPPSLPPPPPPPPPPLPPSFLPKVHTSESASSIPPPPPPLLSSVSLHSPMPPIQPTTPNSSRSNKTRTPTRKCSTPLFNRPNITVEDLLKVTLKKAPQSNKENRQNTVPGPRGPVVSLEMLRNVKLKSAKRRPNDQPGRSPRNGRVIKSRLASNINLSPILTGSEGNLERILRRVDLNRPRRLLSASSSFRERDFTQETQLLETLTYSQSVLE
ncbi:uncharacterized protein LOC112462481 isoform X2 [Temnothorax curvispinosus]|uniref:Uncharacterized protein LOC112462481 isoform X2 n=1 Tax=Temnothorax curvispinosus TaxID=300111 RepID=A0A6J1QTU9_9HYME|nr:uncharacterized protein LOC112462481 isoform X2 [Temnothorax curvispinosus]